MTCGTLYLVWSFVAFEYRPMTIYRTRYRDPKPYSWVSECSPTHAGAGLRRIEAEERLASKKVEVHRFQVNLGKDAIIEFFERAREGVGEYGFLVRVRALVLALARPAYRTAVSDGACAGASF